MIFKNHHPRPWLDGYTPEQITAMTRKEYVHLHSLWYYQQVKAGTNVKAERPWLNGYTAEEIKALPSVIKKRLRRQYLAELRGPKAKQPRRNLGQPWFAGLTDDQVAAMSKTECGNLYSRWRYREKKNRAGKVYKDRHSRRQIDPNRVSGGFQKASSIEIQKLAGIPIGDRWINMVNRFLGGKL